MGVRFFLLTRSFPNMQRPVDLMAVGVMGTVQRSVAGYLMPCKRTVFWYLSSHLVLVKIILQPALHRTRMSMREAMDNPRTICPARIIGSPGITMLHRCIERTMSPFGRLMDRGSVDGQMLLMGMPAIKNMENMEVAPVLAMECVFENAIALDRPRRSADAILCSLDLFDVMAVASLSVLLIVLGSKAYDEISFL
jgi:hypothetical protein